MQRITHGGDEFFVVERLMKNATGPIAIAVARAAKSSGYR